MKKLMMFSMIMALSIVAFAQRGNGDGEAKMEKKVDKMTEYLNLSEDQEAQVKELFATQQKNRKSLGKKGAEMTDEDRAARKEMRKAQKEDFETQLFAILTPEQREAYEAMPKRKGNKKGRKKSSAERVEKKVAKMTEALDLSPAQQTQMTELMANRPKGKKRNKAAMEDMSQEEKAVMKEEYKAEKEAYAAKIEAILTPEQLATYKQMESDRKAEKKAKKKGTQRRSIEE